jgi:hypothetical protein
MTRAAVHLSDGRPGPGRLSEVDLDVLGMGPAELVLAEVTVRDERGGQLFDGAALVFDPAAGGGPLAGQVADRQARAFGVVNAAFHTQRALRYAADLLGHALPRLLVRIGMHDEPRRWGGGHYRLPDPALPDEPEAMSPSGEVHLGGGRAFVAVPGRGRYFHAPAHNAAIVYHEAGHHLCRHTADFRLNRLRPPRRQANKKIALDEGTADLLTAVLLGAPDIYGWQRRAIPESDQRRRMLSPRWTMAHFRGGHDSDPHTDGTVWASACWSARERVAAAGWPPTRFDAMLVRGLELVGDHGGSSLAEEELRGRRHFSRLLAAMVQADPEVASVVLAGMAVHGIRLAASNAELCEAARTERGRRVGT